MSLNVLARPAFIDNELEYKLAFATMYTGIPTINEVNVNLIFNRITFIRMVGGTMFNREFMDLTIEELKKGIGFESNASPLTKAQFIKKYTNHLLF